MTNEELCRLIHEGHRERLTELWEQTKRFGAMQARRFFFSLGELGGLELDDLLQCRWIAMIQAVNYFTPSKGKFLTFYGYTLKNAFRDAAGLRSSKRDPLCDCLSLDLPANSSGTESTMIDFVADSVNQFQVMEEDVYTQQLHEALDFALDSLDPACALHIRQRYYQGMSFRKIADREGCDWQTIRQQEESSFQKLRCGSCAPLLRSFRYWDSEFDIYTKTSLTGQLRGAGSQPEKFAEYCTKRKDGQK